MTTAPTNDVQIAIAAATAAAEVLPSSEPLTAGTPLPGGEGVAVAIGPDGIGEQETVGC